MGDISSNLIEALVAIALNATGSPRTMGKMVAQIIPADHVLYFAVDRLHPSSTLVDCLDAHSRWDGRPLLGALDGHPAVRSYVQHPNDRTPTRVSDLMAESEWTRSALYRSVFEPTGSRYQLSIVTTLRMPDLGRGWILTRSERDFTDRELELAGIILPALAIADRLHPDADSAGDGGADGVPHVTPAETRVLRGVSQGWTAERIGRSLQISPRTVRKHLENAYRKLGCNDRLLATEKARSLGLI